MNVEFETESERRFTRYFKQNGYFFASNSEMENWAQKQPFLKRITEIIPSLGERQPFWINPLINIPKSTWFYTWLPINFKLEDLPKLFTWTAINNWGVWELNLNYEI